MPDGRTTGARRYWWYHDVAGHPVFQHYRYPRKPTPDDPRDKAYGYRYPLDIDYSHKPEGMVLGWVNGKPEGADALIYRLPIVLALPRRVLWLTEGEADADAAAAHGLLATCHHGGAGKFTEAQAECLAKRRGPIVLVADNDPAGARCVVVRYDRLRAVGIPADRLRVAEVAPTHPGADLRDHLEAGYGVRDLRRADLGRLREVAATATPTNSAGSWPRDIRRWRPRVAAGGFLDREGARDWTSRASSLHARVRHEGSNQ